MLVNMRQLSDGFGCLALDFALLSALKVLHRPQPVSYRLDPCWSVCEALVYCKENRTDSTHIECQLGCIRHHKVSSKSPGTLTGRGNWLGTGTAISMSWLEEIGSHG